MTSLDDKFTTEGVETALLEFHREKFRLEADVLRQTYNSVMGRIENQSSGDRTIAKRTLAWMTCAERALRIAELQHGLALEDNSKSLDESNLVAAPYIVFVCRGLITIDETSDTVQFIHSTTQPHLATTISTWFPDAEEYLAMACIRYLSLEEFHRPCSSEEELEDRKQTYPFFTYAAVNWGHHARKASASGTIFTDFLTNEERLNASCQGWGRFDETITFESDGRQPSHPLISPYPRWETEVLSGWRWQPTLAWRRLSKTSIKTSATA